MFLEIITAYKIGIVLFLIGILGFILNRQNILLLMISIEITLLAISFIVICSSIILDDSAAACLSLYILTLAGSEAAIGLSMLVIFHKLRGSISFKKRSNNSIPAPRGGISMIFPPRGAGER